MAWTYCGFLELVYGAGVGAEKDLQLRNSKATAPVLLYGRWTRDHRHNKRIICFLTLRSSAPWAWNLVAFRWYLTDSTYTCCSFGIALARLFTPYHSMVPYHLTPIPNISVIRSFTFSSGKHFVSGKARTSSLGLNTTPNSTIRSLTWVTACYISPINSRLKAYLLYHNVLRSYRYMRLASSTQVYRFILKAFTLLYATLNKFGKYMC